MPSPLNALRCLVLNAGGTYLANKQAAEQWALKTATAQERPDLAFIQEVPSDAWLAQWPEHGYRVVLGHEHGWKVRTAILTRLDEQQCVELTVAEVEELFYHGEYVAAARLVGWGAAGDLTVFSVHASPSPTTDEYLSRHPAPGRLRARDGGADARYAGKLFDSDVVLDTVGRYGPDVLACGDLNEARGWDHAPGHDGHTWGKEYFGTPDEAGQLTGGAVQAAQLVDVPLGIGTQEVVTRPRARAPAAPARPPARRPPDRRAHQRRHRGPRLGGRRATALRAGRPRAHLVHAPPPRWTLTRPGPFRGVRRMPWRLRFSRMVERPDRHRPCLISVTAAEHDSSPSGY